MALSLALFQRALPPKWFTSSGKTLFKTHFRKTETGRIGDSLTIADWGLRIADFRGKESGVRSQEPEERGQKSEVGD